MAGLGGVGRVLATRNTQLYFGGSLLSWTGQWVQKIATDWLAWELTHSPAWVGVVAFCNLAPSVVISPLAGAAADRFDRVKLTVATQLVTAGHALVLATLVLTGLIRVEFMAALEVVLGTAQAFAMPARQSLIPALVGRAELPEAVALNSLCFNLARSAGPAVGGVLVAVWGVVPCLLTNMSAYLLASVTMPLLHLAAAARRGHAPEKSVLRDACEGVIYAVRHPGVGPLFLYAAALGVTVRSVPEMLPPFVDRLFSRGPEGLATLSSSIGLAALIGGLAVAAHGKVTGLVRVSIWGGMALSVMAVGFVATGSFAFATLCAGGMGMMTTVHGIAVQTLLQNSTSRAMLGRMLSLWSMITRAGPALGALCYGTLAEVAGLRVPVLAGGALGILACLWALGRARRMALALEPPPAA